MYPLVVLTLEARMTPLGHRYVLDAASQQACYLAKTLAARFSALIVHADAQNALRQAATWGADKLYWQPLTGHALISEQAKIIHRYVSLDNPDLLLLSEHGPAALLAGWQNWPLIGGCTQIERQDNQLICQHSLDHQDYLSTTKWPCVISCHTHHRLSPPPQPNHQVTLNKGACQVMPDRSIATLAEVPLLVDDPKHFQHAAATWLL